MLICRRVALACLSTLFSVSSNARNRLCLRSADKGTTGTNHVLPTGRAATYSGGLSALRFIKTLTYQRITDPDASRPVAEAVAAISAAEGLPAHGATATRRLARLNGEETPR